MVYANYGRSKDFATLAKENISVQGKIVLMRYGKGARSLKVSSSEPAYVTTCGQFVHMMVLFLTRVSRVVSPWFLCLPRGEGTPVKLSCN